MSTLIEINNDVQSSNEVSSYVPSATIERIDSLVTYNEFFSKYLLANKPCIVDSQVTKDWPCRWEWVQDGAPNFNALRTLFGMSQLQEGSHNTAINVPSIAQDIPLSQSPIVTGSFTIPNSRMTCRWKITWSIG